MHRATINIDDDLWEKLRLLAFEQRRPISKIVNEALLLVLVPPEGLVPPHPDDPHRDSKLLKGAK
jgi:hypothetical protein